MHFDSQTINVSSRHCPSYVMWCRHVTRRTWLPANIVQVSQLTIYWEYHPPSVRRRLLVAAAAIVRRLMRK